ncbi:MAG TPA: 4Fe-4S dicluster domain-containing protein [Bacteroidales bacterium]|nr:4Fe-4S dicluster domain-containing protein [Bacteroidales bacterium]
MANIDFGYTINRDRQIDYDALSRDFYKALIEKEPSVKACISCGTCAATCSAGQFTDYSLRRMILMIRRGDLKDVKTTAPKCMLCGKCQLACPMGVNTRNLIFSLMELLENTSKN